MQGARGLAQSKTLARISRRNVWPKLFERASLLVLPGWLRRNLNRTLILPII
jgi:hypothetical protein